MTICTRNPPKSPKKFGAVLNHTEYTVLINIKIILIAISSIPIIMHSCYYTVLVCTYMCSSLAVDNAGTDPNKDPPGTKQTDNEVKNVVGAFFPVREKFKGQLHLKT